MWNKCNIFSINTYISQSLSQQQQKQPNQPNSNNDPLLGHGPPVEKRRSKTVPARLQVHSWATSAAPGT